MIHQRRLKHLRSAAFEDKRIGCLVDLDDVGIVIIHAKVGRVKHSIRTDHLCMPQANRCAGRPLQSHTAIAGNVLPEIKHVDSRLGLGDMNRF